MDYVTFGRGREALLLLPGLGHAAYEEDPECGRRILTFLQAPAGSPQNPPA